MATMTAEQAKQEAEAATANAQDDALAPFADKPVNSDTVGFIMANFEGLERLAKVMADGIVSVPEAFQGKPADCLAVILKAQRWGMDPFEVVQKTHVVHGTMGYEAQLIASIILRSGVLDGRFKGEYHGDWSKLQGKTKKVAGAKGGEYTVANWGPKDEEGLGLTLSATIRGDSEPKSITVWLADIPPQNRKSTNWAVDPMQQMWYTCTKRWSRRHTPDVIMGLYDPEELRAFAPAAAPVTVDQTPAEQVLAKFAEDKKPAPAEAPAEVVPPVEVIDQKRIRLMFAAANDCEVSKEDLKAHIEGQYGVSSSREIPAAVFDELLAWIRSHTGEAPELPNQE